MCPTHRSRKIARKASIWRCARRSTRRSSNSRTASVRDGRGKSHEQASHYPPRCRRRGGNVRFRSVGLCTGAGQRLRPIAAAASATSRATARATSAGDAARQAGNECAQLECRWIRYGTEFPPAASRSECRAASRPDAQAGSARQDRPHDAACEREADQARTRTRRTSASADQDPRRAEPHRAELARPCRRQQVMENTTANAFAQAPGRTSSLAAAAAARSPFSVRNAKKEDVLAKQPDGIWFVNGKSRDFVITSGGNVVIAGKGFGSAQGRVLASGLSGFPGSAAALQVTAWTEFEIDAMLPVGIRGVPDLDGISAQVFTATGKSFTLGNGKFVAAREEITLTTQLDRLILFQASPAWPWTMATDGGVHRQRGGPCPSPGTDDLLFPPPPRGFEVSGISMQHGRTDSGDGDDSFTPGYSVGDLDTAVTAGGQTAKHVRVNWGVFDSHTSLNLILSQLSGDQCTSDYKVEVRLVGPAGLTPF